MSGDDVMCVAWWWRLGLLQAALILLDLGVATGAAFGDELGQMFALSLHAHALVVAAIVHPLGHVTAAGRVVSLQDTPH